MSNAPEPPPDIPPPDDVRSNVHAGGSVIKYQLTEREKRLCAHIGPKLVRDGLFFAGIDVINGKAPSDKLFDLGFSYTAGESLS